MRTFPTLFAAELAKKTGSTPVWILRLTVDGIVYDLSDSVFTIAGWGTTLPWIANWGAVQESISGTIGEMLVSDFSVTVLVDQDASDNIRSLALTHPLEKSPCQLYLWFDGLDPATDPPQVMLQGYVKDVDLPDETQVHLTIEDESTRLQQFLGTRISSEAYPLCDPDVVGKVIPIVYGTVPKLPALCVDSGWVSSIPADLSAIAGSFLVSEIPAYSLNGKTITIDDEQMLVQPGSSGTNFINAALAINGGVASATSSYPGYPAANAINGTTTWSNAGGSAWNAAIPTTFLPQSLRVDFVAPIMLTNFNLYFTADNLANPPFPGPTVTGTLYVQPNFTLYYSADNGASWILLNAVTGNNHVLHQTVCTARLATNIRVDFTSLRQDGVTVTCIEVEAWGATLAPVTVPKTLTVTRGYNGTSAQAHTKGSTVIEKKATPLVYLCADHALDAIGTIYARVRGILVDITSDCTKYLGSSASQLVAYPGRAAITIPDFAKVQQRISLVLQGDVTGTDPGHTHNSSASGGTATQDQDASGANTTLGQISLRWEAVNNQNKFPSAQEAVAKAVTFAAPAGTPYAGTMTATVTVHLPATGGYWYLLCGGKRITPVYGNGIDNWAPAITHDATSIQGNLLQLVIGAFPTGQYAGLTALGEGTISAAHRQVTYSTSQSVIITPAGTGVLVKNTLGLSGNSVADIMIGDMVLVDCTRSSCTLPIDVLTDVLTRAGDGHDSNLFTESECRHGTSDLSTASNVSAGSLSGYAGAIQFAAGAVNKIAYKGNFTTVIGQAYCLSVVVKMGDLSVPRISDGNSGTSATDVIGIIGNAYPAAVGVAALGGDLYRCSWSMTASAASAANGCLQLAGNSNKALTVTAYQLNPGTTPNVYITTMVDPAINRAIITQTGALPATYALNGAITEYKKTIEWLDYLSFQSRAFFRKIGGVSRLIIREINPAINGTIPACCLTSEGIKDLKYKKATLADVINRVVVHYGRDWTASGKQAEAYQLSVGGSDAVSIANFGEQERPDMFMFDFVTSSPMAADLYGFYLDFYADRKWRISFSTYLDQARYQFGDIVQLDFADGLVGVVVEAGMQPGSLDQIDQLHFVVEAAIIPLPVTHGMTSLLGEQVHTKQKEAITYV